MQPFAMDFVPPKRARGKNTGFYRRIPNPEL
jgi:hypothetical protein